MGYDAHLDPLSREELQQWQQAFTRLTVNGKSCNLSMKLDDSIVSHPALSRPRESHPIEFPLDGSLERPIQIIGSKAIIHDMLLDSQKDILADSEDEIIDGVLEETICIDQSEYCLLGTKSRPDHKAIDIYDDNIVSPQSTRYVEDIDKMFDAIWPQVVEQLRPLLLETAKEFVRLRTSEDSALK